MKLVSLHGRWACHGLIYQTRGHEVLGHCLRLLEQTIARRSHHPMLELSWLAAQPNRRADHHRRERDNQWILLHHMLEPVSHPLGLLLGLCAKMAAVSRP